MTLEDMRFMLLSIIFEIDKNIEQIESDTIGQLEEYSKTKPLSRTDTISVTEALGVFKTLSGILSNTEISTIIKDLGTIINTTPFLCHKGYEKTLVLESMNCLRKTMGTIRDVLKEISDKLIEDKHNLDSY